MFNSNIRETADDLLEKLLYIVIHQVWYCFQKEKTVDSSVAKFKNIIAWFFGSLVKQKIHE